MPSFRACDQWALSLARLSMHMDKPFSLVQLVGYLINGGIRYSTLNDRRQAHDHRGGSGDTHDVTPFGYIAVQYSTLLHLPPHLHVLAGLTVDSLTGLLISKRVNVGQTKWRGHPQPLYIIKPCNVSLVSGLIPCRHPLVSSGHPGPWKYLDMNGGMSYACLGMCSSGNFAWEKNQDKYRQKRKAP